MVRITSVGVDLLVHWEEGLSTDSPLPEDEDDREDLLESLAHRRFRLGHLSNKSGVFTSLFLAGDGVCTSFSSLLLFVSNVTRGDLLGVWVWDAFRV